MRVDLRGTIIGVPEHGLDVTQLRATDAGAIEHLQYGPVSHTVGRIHIGLLQQLLDFLNRCGR